MAIAKYINGWFTKFHGRDHLYEKEWCSLILSEVLLAYVRAGF